MALAQAFGIEAFRLDAAADSDAALQRLLASKGPALLHVAIDAMANVWPLVPPNHTNAQMLFEPAQRGPELHTQEYADVALPA